MKPLWHDGEWTEEDALNLIDELQEAQTYRSLTNEEAEWLSSQQ